MLKPPTRNRGWSEYSEPTAFFTFRTIYSIATVMRTDIPRLWRRLMTNQTNLLFPSELPFFVRSMEWQSAQNVVDLGTCTGYYLAQLAYFFPEKQYTGVDHSSTNIAAANRFFRIPRVRERVPVLNFIVRDVLEIKDQFDVAVARLLLQHL